MKKTIILSLVLILFSTIKSDEKLIFDKNIFFKIVDFKTEKNNINFRTDIQDQFGDSYYNINEANFSVNYKKKVKFNIKKSYEPLLINIIYDASNSVLSSQKNMKKIVNNILNSFSDKDKFSLITFNNTTVFNNGYTSRKDIILKNIEKTKIKGSSLLYDSISSCMNTIKDQKLSKIIIIISDGKDQAISSSRKRFSRKSRKEIIDQAQKEDVNIYTIAASKDQDKLVLSELADQTKAIFIENSSSLDIKNLKDKIEKNRKYIYTVLFTDNVLENIDHNRNFNIRINFSKKENDINFVIHPQMKMFEYYGEKFENNSLLSDYRLLDAELISVDTRKYPVISCVFIGKSNNKYIKDINENNIELNCNISWKNLSVNKIDRKISYSILIDKSGSMGISYDKVKENIMYFNKKIASNNVYSVNMFDKDYYILKNYNASNTFYIDLNSSKPIGPTALYDNIAKCAADLSVNPDPRGIILFSDGFDRRYENSHIRLSKMDLLGSIYYCYGLNIPIYCIACSNYNFNVLDKLTRRTAGKLYLNLNKEAMDLIFNELTKNNPCYYDIKITEPFIDNSNYDLFLEFNYKNMKKIFKFEM